MEKLLILNPGSTSTKIAVYEDETPLFVESISHSADEIAKYDLIVDQFEFRKDMILDVLKEKGVALDTLTGIVARGGLLPPLKAGAYRVNDDMAAEKQTGYGTCLQSGSCDRGFYCEASGNSGIYL